MKISTVIGLSLLVAGIMLAGSGKSEAATAPAESTASTNKAPAVDLSPSQLNAIKIGTLGTYSFPVEKEEVGNVSFDEDPSEIQAESTLLGAAATFVLTSNELVRAKALSGTNGVSQRELEQATSDAQTAEAALKAARYAVLALGVTDDEIDEMIAAGRMDIAKSSYTPPKWVLANVTESDSPSFRTGQPLKVKVTAFPDRVFEGKIYRIYATVDPNVHRQAIRCEVNDPGNELVVGMLARVVIQVSPPVEATAIPANGVIRQGDGTMTAWVTTDRQHFTQRIIKTGMREDGEVQILDGLQRGEQVVTDGAIFLDNMVNAAPSD